MEEKKDEPIIEEDEEEYIELEDKTPEGVEEVKLETPKDYKNPLNEKDYSKYIDENEQVKTFLEYQRLKDR